MFCTENSVNMLSICNQSIATYDLYKASPLLKNKQPYLILLVLLIKIIPDRGHNYTRLSGW